MLTYFPARQSAAIYGLPPTSGNQRTLSDGSPTKQDGDTKAMFPFSGT